MAKKARQRISYVLPLVGNQSGGHRLGVNGLAIDRDNAILYSGGRDGVVCAWDLNLDLKNPESQAAASNATANGAAAKSKSTTTFRAQTQAHTHWINDLALAQNHTALISASSDLTVKVWRPHGNARAEPVTIGQHADYVKSVVAPDQQSDWVASGGLDRKIYLWDLNGKGEKLHIDVSGEEITEKGSVYALAATHNMLASGGPESVVRLWDPRTGKNITKFVGHTDNVRAILVNEPGDMILTASSDQTVKVWSVTAGRCMHTLTMHNDSVWTLFSDQPDLGIFYSGDRSGLVVKTDVRGTLDEMDDGISLAVAQEQESVSKVVACGGHIWTTTSSSSINRWEDVDTGADIALPEALRQHRASISTQVSASRPREASPPAAAAAANGAPAKKEIPAKAVLRISNTARFPAPLLASEASVVAGSGITRKGSEVLQDASSSEIVPIHHLPEETIEGQFGLVKHRLLNDRRRVLTLDTAGEVLLWDLIQCKPIQNFGKKHLEDVEPEVNTLEAVAPWCSVDTSSGSLTVVLEPYNCFDAEMYADELVLDEPVEFREDQRINLGKWILRYLFAKLIDEEIKRDEAHRAKINEGVEARIAAAAANPPPPITIPPPNMDGWDQGDGSATTPRANGASYPPTTPGMGIGVVTPGAPPPGTPGTPLERRQSHLSRPSTDKDDYFSSNAISSAEQAKPAVTPAETAASTDKEGKTSMENGKDKEKEKEKEKEKDNGKTASTPFGKKFRMGMSFGSKKLGRSASSTAPEKPAVVDEKTEERSESSSNHEKEVDDSFLGTIQKIHNEYDKQVLEAPEKPVETRVVPSLASETPVLKLPPATKVIIQEETSGGSAELYRGTVETVGLDADVIEHKGPMWLGEVLLTNSVPPKEPVKVSFILHPWQDALPSLSVTDGNNRLNANRMLRVKKILSYIAERIEPAPPAGGGGGDDPDALKPEEYLELYCNEQLLPITMSLATLRAHVWKGGNDIVLYYKANGRKEIPNPPPPIEPAVPEEPEQEAEAEAAAAAASSAPPAQTAAPVTA